MLKIGVLFTVTSFFVFICHFQDDCLLILLPPSVSVCGGSLAANEITAVMTTHHSVEHSSPGLLKVLQFRNAKKSQHDHRV